ncbi:putative outer membrane starch-binding protein [Chitinophaga skermanii]|uniref:Putative outer membrane starch-binding protein n=1 Tax=Chitinophaga skermanii TaxID=331697 RepID=A0A327QXX2_9BACT|nr:RagB/SusD family nutrient uptake outer membrane protein [Chitinophaga skermanii]RAJ08815.1 putative outer membrane starch-binding protein [Chitinophaga skermanii]
MKKINRIILSAVLASSVMGACKESFLEKTPQGELAPSQLQNTDGVEGALIGAYGLLNGNLSGTWGNYSSAPSQWLYGEVASDNAHKGSNSGDQPNMNQIELYQATAVNDNADVMWSRCYEGILRVNNTLRLLAAVQAGSGNKFSDTRAKEIEGEAKMLRAHYYFFLVRLFKNVPYIDENTPTSVAATTKNDKDVYPMIIADLTTAVANLPATKPKGEVGRVDKIAATAYLGKVLLYNKQYGPALTHFKTVMAARPDITTLNFLDNFDVTKENGPESIFAVQHAINPDGSGDNANVGDMLGGLYGNAPVSCCGFFQPTIDLVNAYKTTAAGLPYLDNTYRNAPVILSDFGLTAAQKAAYVLDKTSRVDPRLDYTVGRRSVPYRDWGPMAGDSWIRDPAYAGPFVGVKHMIEAAQFGTQSVAGANYVTGLNVNIIRLADVYLMAAECEAEANNYEGARTLVNKIRQRAANLPAKQVGGTPAANYLVSQYTTAWTDKATTLKAIHFERRLELALEGHRWYDLVRWGEAKATLEAYSAFEGTYLSSYKNLVFTEKNTYYPIPQPQIDRSKGALSQN